jgi:hypothetical protein
LTKSDQKVSQAVQEAYDLKIVADNPSSTLTKYELARTLMHFLPMAKLGMNLFEMDDTLLKVTESALELDSDNPLY